MKINNKPSVRYILVCIVNIVLVFSLASSAFAAEEVSYKISSKMNDEEQLEVTFTNLGNTSLEIRRWALRMSFMNFSFWIDGKPAYPFKRIKIATTDPFGKEVINPNESINRVLHITSKYSGLSEELKKHKITLKWNTKIKLLSFEGAVDKTIEVSDELVLNPNFEQSKGGT